MCSNSFKNCTSLKEINFPDALESIEHGAFDGCKSLKKLTIPKNVSFIDSRAFKDCTSLTILNWNTALITSLYDSLDRGVFESAGTKGAGIDVVFSDDIENIPQSMFGGDYTPKISSITLGKATKTIGNNAFNNLQYVESIVIPETLTTPISYGIFNGWTSLSEIYYCGSEKQWAELSKCAYLDEDIYVECNRDENNYSEPAEVTATELTSINVALKNCRKRANVILGLYKNGACVDVQTAEYNGKGICFTTPLRYDEAKVFVWEDEATMLPYCESLLMPEAQPKSANEILDYLK